MNRLPSPPVRIFLSVVVPTATALVPLVRHVHWVAGPHHIYSADPADWTSALVPLLGALASLAALALTWRGARRSLLALVPYLVLVGVNALVWTRMVGFDPCYGDESACADIGGGPMKVLGFFLVMFVMPALALVVGLVQED